jgi:polysaccharide pyruvyl transferase WcaK-like protein
MRLGVNFGSTNNALWGTNDADFAQVLFEALTVLKNKGWTFSFMSVWQKDIPYLEKLREQLGDAAAGPVLDARDDTLQCYSMLASCEVFLGEKLHANAMAAVAGTPFVALEYQPKVRDFAASVAMEEWVISTATADPAIIADLVESLHRERLKVKSELLSAHALRRQSILQFTTRIKHKLMAATIEGNS